MQEDVAVLQEVAFAVIQGDGTIRTVRGCTVIRFAVGLYIVTINPNGAGGPSIDTSELVATVCPVNALSRRASVENVLANSKNVNMADQAGVAADSEFSITLSRLL